MLRFCCEKCGCKISVQDKNAGMKAKCPKCKNLLIVPKKSNTIDFICQNCGQKISVLKNSGQKGRCPNCKNLITVPGTEKVVIKAKKAEPDDTTSYLSGSEGLTLLEVPEELRIQDLVEKNPEAEQNNDEQKIYRTTQVKETVPEGKRSLPWFIDVFLYPIGGSTLVHLVLLSFLPSKLIPMFRVGYWYAPPLFGLGFMVVYISYFFYCVSELIRDSSTGNKRRPVVEISTEVLFDVWEIISTVPLMFINFVFCFGPLLIYFFITKRIDLFLVLLAGYAVFFTPICLLATVMFDSVRALNPVLIVVSIFSVLIPYLGLTLIFFAFVGVVTLIMFFLPLSGFLCFLLSAICIYLIMVLSHILGRFVYRYREKLNWEC